MLPCQARGEAPAFPPLSVTGKAVPGKIPTFCSVPKRHTYRSIGPAGRTGQGLTGGMCQWGLKGDSFCLRLPHGRSPPAPDTVPGSGHRTLGSGNWAPDTELRTGDTGHWGLDTELRTGVTGHWAPGTAPTRGSVALAAPCGPCGGPFPERGGGREVWVWGCPWGFPPNQSPRR